MEIGGRDLSPVPPPRLVAPAPDKETANEEVGVQREADHRDAGIAFVRETCTAVSSPSSNFQCAVRRPDGMPVYRNPVLRGEVAGDLLGALRRNSSGICVSRPVGDGCGHRRDRRRQGRARGGGGQKASLYTPCLHSESISTVLQNAP